ncbi:MAG TPA: SDR family oxidoreductase [Burkholderiaceae bacterium]|nr:SDR family oxidoreductase [Burkholderiaceae bacterium]
MPRNVFITGASSGIGAALAHEYAARGATLGLVARRREALEKLAASLPGTHHLYAVDVTATDALIAAARAFDQACGGTDIVIANAGISVGVLSEFHEDLATFREVLETNVLAMAATFHPFIAPMRARAKGQLVGIGSTSGIRGLPGSEAYCASKAAVISYLESLRVELARDGIRVQTICPGFVRTPLTAKNPYPMPFVIDPDDFARRAVAAIARGTSYAVIPWPAAVLAKLLRVLPNWAFDRLFANRPYKPRKAQSAAD